MLNRYEKAAKASALVTLGLTRRFEKNTSRSRPQNVPSDIIKILGYNPHYLQKNTRDMLSDMLYNGKFSWEWGPLYERTKKQLKSNDTTGGSKCKFKKRNLNRKKSIGKKSIGKKSNKKKKIDKKTKKKPNKKKPNKKKPNKKKTY